MTETTCDGLLNRRLMLEQPKRGYRIAVDTVLLAAGVPAEAGQTILDLGCGVGGAMLCVACRVPDTHVTGVEIQQELAELCQRNIQRNGFGDRAEILRADIVRFESRSAFDHVMMNPPYHDEARHDVSEHAGKRLANSGKESDVSLWISKAVEVLNSEGAMTIIHRADVLDRIVTEAQRYFGRIEILPILPKIDAPPKRVIVRARRGKTEPPRIFQALILHNQDGHYTEQAERILRHAETLFASV